MDRERDNSAEIIDCRGAGTNVSHSLTLLTSAQHEWVSKNAASLSYRFNKWLQISIWQRIHQPNAKRHKRRQRLHLTRWDELNVSLSAAAVCLLFALDHSAMWRKLPFTSYETFGQFKGYMWMGGLLPRPVGAKQRKAARSDRATSRRASKEREAEENKREQGHIWAIPWIQMMHEQAVAHKNSASSLSLKQLLRDKLWLHHIKAKMGENWQRQIPVFQIPEVQNIKLECFQSPLAHHLSEFKPQHSQTIPKVRVTCWPPVTSYHTLQPPLIQTQSNLAMGWVRRVEDGDVILSYDTQDHLCWLSASNIRCKIDWNHTGVWRCNKGNKYTADYITTMSYNSRESKVKDHLHTIIIIRNVSSWLPAIYGIKNRFHTSE